MQLILVLSALVAVALCAPCTVDVEKQKKEAAIKSRRKLPALEHEEIHDQYGQFALRYVTAEGTVVSERGRLVPNGHGDYVLVTEGEVSYIGDDGELYISHFSAGLDGYKYESNHPLKAPEPAAPAAA